MLTPLELKQAALFTAWRQHICDFIQWVTEGYPKPNRPYNPLVKVQAGITTFSLRNSNTLTGELPESNKVRTIKGTQILQTTKKSKRRDWDVWKGGASRGRTTDAWTADRGRY